MKDHSFSLVPFPDLDIPKIEITGKISRVRNLLRIRYCLSGSSSNILIPEPAGYPARKDELWLETCFEFFLAHPGHPSYWEFNLSPSGDWNIFRMDAYRRAGFRQEEKIQGLQIRIGHDDGRICLDADVNLSPIMAAGNRIQAGVASVIQTRDRHETYWALAHPGARPDFHLRESFMLEI